MLLTSMVAGSETASRSALQSPTVSIALPPVVHLAPTRSMTNTSTVTVSATKSYEPPLTASAKAQGGPAVAVLVASGVLNNLATPMEAAKALVGTASLTAPLGGLMLSAAISSHATRWIFASGAIYCTYSGDDVDTLPTFFEHPFQISVGHGSFAHYLGSTVLMFSVLIAFPLVVLWLVWAAGHWRDDSSPANNGGKDWLAIAQKNIISRFTAVAFLFAAPVVVKSTVVIMTHSNNWIELLVAALLLGFTLLPMSNVVRIVIVRFYLGAVAAKTLTTMQYSTPISTILKAFVVRMMTPTGRPVVKESSSKRHDRRGKSRGKESKQRGNGKHRSTKAAVTTPKTVEVVEVNLESSEANEFFVESFFHFFGDAQRFADVDSRSYYLEQLTISSAFALLDGIRPRPFATGSHRCTGIASSMLFLSVVHAVYIAFVRPFKQFHLNATEVVHSALLLGYTALGVAVAALQPDSARGDLVMNGDTLRDLMEVMGALWLCFITLSSCQVVLMVVAFIGSWMKAWRRARNTTHQDDGSPKQDPPLPSSVAKSRVDEYLDHMEHPLLNVMNERSQKEDPLLLSGDDEDCRVVKMDSNSSSEVDDDL